MDKIPLSTYRIQFNPKFKFKDADAVVPYLHELGISYLYASPIFKARKGSSHGYDVVDSNEISPVLGRQADFDRLVSHLHDRNMGWLQDIVPNHMAVDYENKMLRDVLENGIHSPYINFFDIEWNHPYESIKGRFLAPFLGKFYNECLENGEIQVHYDPNGFTVDYYDLKFPLKIESYGTILSYRVPTLKQRISRDHPDYIKLLGILYVLRTLDTGDEIGDRHDQTRFIKRILWELYTTNSQIKAFVDENIAIFNGKDGSPGYALLDSLLSEQLFRLAFWKVTTEETNYRRFFNINGLISLRIEDEDVFNKTHQLIFNLVDAGIVNGLRIDHIDGLYDPTTYLERLRKQIKNIYLIVEKILELDEDFPEAWPVDGATGYAFVNFVNGLFCNTAKEKDFNGLYNSFIQQRLSYKNLVYEKKKLIIDKDMSGDVDNLAHLMKRISANDRYGNDITLNGLRRAIVEVLAFFPVYRTYINNENPHPEGKPYIWEAILKAKNKRPDLMYELNFVQRFICLEFDDNVTEEEKNNWVHWIMRFQQISGPLMAKGFEDTTLYIYNRLLSLNEVGGNPSRFGITLEDFHKFNKRRVISHPHAMNAGSTHDTKRGEDIRARINVLSEMPQEWEARIKIWNRMNRGGKQAVGEIFAPDKNDEYFFYQMLLGAYPFEKDAHDDFVQRYKEYIIKAIREAKVHTEWLKPDTAYEEAFISFVEKVLDIQDEHNVFLKSFRPFQKKIAFFGILNSLSQLLIRMSSPGVPDIYQGCELWDFSFVDPDNRRPVDYEYRTKTLRDISKLEGSDIDALIQDLWKNRTNGAIKLFLLQRALSARKNHSDLFQKGSYFPVQVRGRHKRNVVAYGRRLESKWVLTFATRFFTTLVKEGQMPFGAGLWDNTYIKLPDGAPVEWKDAVNDHTFFKSGEVVILKDLFTNFHVSMIIGEAADPNVVIDYESKPRMTELSKIEESA